LKRWLVMGPLQFPHVRLEWGTLSCCCINTTFKLLCWLEMQQLSLSLPSHVASQVLVENHATCIKGTQDFDISKVCCHVPYIMKTWQRNQRETWHMT
jgi:hypothetical protein